MLPSSNLSTMAIVLECVSNSMTWYHSASLSLFLTISFDFSGVDLGIWIHGPLHHEGI